MNVIRRRGWEIPEHLATPEHFFFNRRALLVGGASALAMMPSLSSAQRVSDVPDPTSDLYPAKRNETTNSTGRSPTRRSTPTTTTSTNSTRRRKSPTRRRSFPSGHGR
jgi:sulfoxide reductase catalytic subunit YedY